MLMMLEKPQESEQLANCRKLLEYIDGQFQERIRAGRVDYRSYVCGSFACLLGWYAIDVLNMEGEAAHDWCDFLGYYSHTGDYFGMSNDTDSRVFGIARGNINQRRAALVDHIKHLEAQEMLEAA